MPVSSTVNSNLSSWDTNDLKNIDQIQSAFQQLSKEEKSIDDDLEQILSEQFQLETKLKSLTVCIPELKSVQGDATKLSSVISFTAKLAEGVSIKVKQLDLAKSRVSECQQRVNDLIDLKLCSDGVKMALSEENYEQAAAHLHRFLSMDEDMLKLTASEIREEGNTESGLASVEQALFTLHEAETKVKEVIATRFDEAVKAEDLASIERFFKIFPLINMHEEGLKKFSNYLCQKLVVACEKNLKQAVDTPATDPRANVIFADTLTLLFEGIARTVEIHQPLIETYYGPGKLLTAISLLQEECDRQSNRILNEFRKKKNVREKIAKVKEALYGHVPSNQKVSAKVLDHVLSEMSLLEARTEMYHKFVKKRITADLQISTEDESVKETKLEEMRKLISNSSLCRSMQDLLSEYLLMEDYFMSENIRIAIENGNYLETNDQLTSVMLDDVFFILKKCIQRSMNSHCIDGVCAIVNNACRNLEQDFCGLLHGQLKMGFPSGYLDLTHAYNVLHSSYQHGKLQGGDTEKQKAVFLTALNNTNAAVDYINRLKSTLENDINQTLANRSEMESEKIQSCLAGFPSVSDKLKVVLEQGMQLLRQSAIRPRIKPWMDSFTNHDINEEQFSDFEANDPFVQNLILNVDNLLGSFKKSLTEENYDSLVSILSTEVTTQLEKAIMKTKFSRLGGLLLDREVRSLASFLTSVTTWTIRDKFSRLTQIATILNLETVNELSDIYGPNAPAAMTWELTSSEIRHVLVLRKDFPPEEIKRLRF